MKTPGGGMAEMMANLKAKAKLRVLLNKRRGSVGGGYGVTLVLRRAAAWLNWCRI